MQLNGLPNNSRQGNVVIMNGNLPRKLPEAPEGKNTFGQYPYINHQRGTGTWVATRPGFEWKTGLPLAPG